jgi:rhodanese-related sulfurtransferase
MHRVIPVIFILLFSLPSLMRAQIVNIYDFSNEVEFSEFIVMPEEVMYKIRNGDSDFELYDVRGSNKYAKRHIIGAENYPWADGSLMESFESFPMDRNIYIISEDGTIGFDALRFLLEKGFSRVYNIEGGMANWLYKDLLK